jgi:hypothetical protein
MRRPLLLLAVSVGGCAAHGVPPPPPPRATADAGVDAAEASAPQAEIHEVVPPAPEEPATLTVTAPRTFVFRRVESWNLHMADEAGAEGENDASDVTIHIDPVGRCRAIDHGTNVESVLSGDRYEEKTTDWRTTWSGTWTLAAGTLSLDLTREGAACTVTDKTRIGAQVYLPTKTPCATPDAHVAVECKARRIDLSPALSNPGATPTRTAAWICEGRDAASTAIETRFPWVFGERCVESTGGSRFSIPVTYAPCPP